MAPSAIYLECLELLEPNDSADLDTLWCTFRAEYLTCSKYLITHALHTLAECCLTIVAKHREETDKIVGARSLEFWFMYLIGEMKQLHISKNAGCSGHNVDPWHNFRLCEQFEINTRDGIVTRMCDKYARYTNITNDPKLERVGERAIDTLMDLAAYSMILSIIINEKE